MFTRKIGLALGLVLLTAALAQQAPKSHVTVQVTDVTGAAVPKALVQIHRANRELEFSSQTDGKGDVNFDLPQGDYELSVTSLGFYFKSRPITVDAAPAQKIAAKLVPGGCPIPEPCPIVAEAAPSIEKFQQMPGRVSIRVTDETGAVAPDAQAVFDPGKERMELKTDLKGSAAIDLPPGPHTVSITLPGFERWTMYLNISSSSTQKIDAVLKVAGTDDPIEVEVVVDCPLETSSLELEVVVPLQQMKVFTAFPLRSFRRRH